MPSPSRKRFDVVLFDIDNVLVDTRASYLAAIQKTVEIYLNHPGIVSLKEIDQFKLLGGFNDDWDACFGIIAFLHTAIQGKPIRFGDHRRRCLTIAELNDLFPERPLGIEGLLKHLEILYEQVETPPYRKVAQIFQEVYLGKKLLRKRCLFWKNPGLVEKEKPIFPKALLEKIHGRGVRFGIVTGRNRFEAEYALKRFGILKLFDSLVTIDRVRREEKKTGRILRKPHPWSVLEAARRIKKKNRKGPLRFLYVGDLPDDVLAAKRAAPSLSIKSAAFPAFTRDPEATHRELAKVKPAFLLKRPQDLLKILFLEL